MVTLCLPQWYWVIGTILGALVFLGSVVYDFVNEEDIRIVISKGIAFLLLGVATVFIWPILIVLTITLLLCWGFAQIIKNANYIKKWINAKIKSYYEYRQKSSDFESVTKEAENKYKSMLSEALEAIAKYYTNLSKTKLTPDGKAIIASVGVSINEVSRIIKNSTSERITVDVFEKAYEAIKANRIELQRAEKLVSLGIEQQLEDEIKLMRATLPR